MPSAVSWRYDYGTEPWLRWLVRAGMGAVFGVYAGILALGSLGVVLVFFVGSTEVKLLVVLLALVGGPFSLLYLLPMITDRSQRKLPFTDREPRIPGRERVVVGIVGGLALAVATAIDEWLALALFAAGFLAGTVGVVCSTRGEIDPETATYENEYREWDLARVTDYSARRLGPLVVVTPSASGPGRFGAVPSWLLVPVTVADDATAALDEIVATTEADPGRDPNRAVRAVAVAFAVLLFGTGAAAVTQLDGPIGWWAATITGFFAVIFLAVAREG
ncbi:hypothetical protein SAMN05216388_1002172 [Halorientalis persicus]|jgi:hypothetical protein|uniref:Uncharacterized protein n=1 Tax=Halorientalis persicus TaxID=1367881 RepID=A0A1H8F1V6_9EURY|nr:hypothetical protein [Halorientalis persicus]SEN25733.1 hypothetical protein SAMN05216388_1002172 [Halorientalis persicus]